MSVRAATDLLERFSGQEATTSESIDIELPEAVLFVGYLTGVMYRAVRDGEEIEYLHEFKESSQPQLMASSDGSGLWIVGGNFEFTERGIEDR